MHPTPKPFLKSTDGPTPATPPIPNLTDFTPKREQKGTHRNKFDNQPLKPLDDPTLSDAARAIIGMRSRFQQLKPHHHLAIELLIRGLNDRQVAEQLGRDRSRITKWRNYNPYFRAELARRRQEVFGSFADNLRFTLSTCLEELQSQLKHEDLNVRNRAANQIINHAKHKGFQPPPEPTDPAALMAQLARQKKVELHLHDNPFYGPLEEDDFLNAMEDLDEKSRNYPLARDQHPEDAPDPQPQPPDDPQDDSHAENPSPRTREESQPLTPSPRTREECQPLTPSPRTRGEGWGEVSPGKTSCSPGKSDRPPKPPQSKSAPSRITPPPPDSRASENPPRHPQHQGPHPRLHPTRGGGT